MSVKLKIPLILRLLKIKFEPEYKFHPTRKWKFDFAIPDRKIAIEYEGIFSKKARHTTATGYTGDTEKYNQAVILGWRVLRYTALSKESQILEDLKAIE